MNFSPKSFYLFVFLASISGMIIADKFLGVGTWDLLPFMGCFIVAGYALIFDDKKRKRSCIGKPGRFD